MSTTTVAPKKEKSAKPKVEAWPESFAQNGIRQRKAYTKIFGSEGNTAQDFVPWTQTDAKTFDDFVKFVGGDKVRLLEWALKGFNDGARQNAAFAEKKIQTMIANAMKANPKLSAAKAGQLVRAMLAAEG